MALRLLPLFALAAACRLPVVSVTDAGVVVTAPGWSADSATAKARLEQQGLDAPCTLRCTRDGVEAWSATSADACIASAHDFKFVSNDCEKVVVVRASLPAGDTQWKATPVMRVYARAERLEGYAGEPMIRRADVKLKDGQLWWLAGVDGAQGRPPRYAKGGAAVEFEVLTGKRTRYPLPAPAEVEAVLPPPGPGGGDLQVIERGPRPTAPSYYPAPPPPSYPAPRREPDSPPPPGQLKPTGINDCRSKGALCDSGRECCSHWCDHGWCG